MKTLNLLIFVLMTLPNTLSYSQKSPKEVWVMHYCPDSTNELKSMKIDRLGNVYVTGISKGEKTNLDYATIKYNKTGEQKWVSRYNSPIDNKDEATALVIDESGSVYVTGSSIGLGTSYDYCTIKYNNEGIEQWVARYNGSGNYLDYATALAIDKSGNVYVTGGSEGRGTEHDYATIKYNNAGVEQWKVFYDVWGTNDWGESGSLNDGAEAIAIDRSENVYVTGWSGLDIATLKYNRTVTGIALEGSEIKTVSGTHVWVERYLGGVATALTIDDNDNVYVTGRTKGKRDKNSDYITVKYNSNGVRQWVAIYNGPANSKDVAYAISVDRSGNVYVTGKSGGLETDYDYATIKYDPNGVELWIARY